MRSTLKALVEALVAGCGPAALSRRAFRRRALVLAYHNVLPDGAAPGADQSLHLPLTRFREQLELLAATAQVVPLAEVLGPQDDAPDRPRVAITFDDAYGGAVTVALPELERRGLPVTMFVTPGVLGGAGFWWDAVHAADGAGLPEGFRREALETGRGEGERVRALAVARGLSLREPAAACRPASEAELTRAARWEGLTLGAHTWSHPNLARLDGHELPAELGPPLDWLRERFPRTEPWIAYPYGLTGPAVEVAAREAGYRAGFLVSGGWLPAAGRNPFRLPRLNIPAGLSRNGFVLRTSGLVPA